MKDLFSFFYFYYYSFTRNPKRFDLVRSTSGAFTILTTPPALSMLTLIVLVVIGSPSLDWVFYFHIIAYLINFLIYELTLKKANKIVIEKEKARRREETKRREQRVREEFYEKVRRAQRKREHEWWQNQWKEHTTGTTGRSIYNDSRLNKSLNILGLSSNATKESVKKAYRGLCKVHHPDMGGRQEDFVKVNNAYKYIMERF